MKYILVTGGVISSVGKGVVTSSVGTILKAHGIRVTCIKIDPYINIDAGTFSPYEHGEVFVLNDGGEVDLDLGNYERFLDITLSRDNNITTGKIYQHVIDKERRGDYLGKTVQVVPHITDAIQEWVERVARVPVDSSNIEPDVCVIELGGTIGDIEGMPFVEAFRQFQFRASKENFINIHVSLIPEPSAAGEQKTKPTQNSVRELRGLGLSPDLIVCRCHSKLQQSVKEKVSMFCHVPPSQVLDVHDVSSIYRVPLLLEDQSVAQFLVQRLQLQSSLGSGSKSRNSVRKWRELADRYDRLLKEVSIALVGKYTKLEDSYASVVKALRHASIACGYRLDLKCIEADNLEEKMMHSNPSKYHDAWKMLCNCDGILVPGGFGTRGVEGKIMAAKWAREHKKPYLGICLGLQCAVIEYARNVLKLTGANSAEIDKECKHPLVIEMPEHHTGQLGGTMRLGMRTTYFDSQDSVLRKLYSISAKDSVDHVDERHRHRYEVNPEYVPRLEESGLKFVGRDDTKQRMEIIENPEHPYFVAVQYHPEYISRPLKPSPPYLGLILAACGKLKTFLSREGGVSPRLEKTSSSDSESTDDELDYMVPSPYGAK